MLNPAGDVTHRCENTYYKEGGLDFELVLRLKDLLHGSIKFIFQPAEEGGAGAQVMVDEGVLSNPEVDEIYGLHVWNHMKPGLLLSRLVVTLIRLHWSSNWPSFSKLR
jgi:hypothetical protein